MSATNVDTNNVDVERMSKETRISTWEIKNALGIPLEIPNVTTIEEAEDLYHQSPGKNSEAGQAALQNWVNLITTIEETSIFCIFALEGSDVHKTALMKWADFSLAEVEQAETIEEISEAFNRAPRDRKTRRIAMMKWIDRTETIEEIRYALSTAHFDSKAEEAALRKFNDLVIAKVDEITTPEEARKLFDQTPDCSEANETALMNWIDRTETILSS